MDNSENCFAGALFFTLVSVGTFLKVDDVAISVAIGITSALIAAIFLKMGVNRVMDESDEAQQRLTEEIRKLNQSSVTTDYSSEPKQLAQMSAVNEVADAIRDHFQTLQANLVDLKVLAEISATSKAIYDKLDNLNNLNVNTPSDDIGAALNSVNENLIKTNNAIAALTVSMSEDVKKLSGISAANGATSEEILSVLKDYTASEDFEKVNAFMDTLFEKISVLNDLKELLEKSKSDVSELLQAGKIIVAQNEKIIEVTTNAEKSVRETMANFAETGDEFAKTSKSLTKLFDDMNRDINKLTDKFDTYNGLTRATLEQYSNLTDQDVTILEKIAEKINGK